MIESGEEAIRKDELINQSIEQRLQAQQQNIPFRDEVYLSEIPAIVPEELRPKPEGLSLEEFMIYDEIKMTNQKDKLEELSFREKLNELLHEKAEAKCYKELLQNDVGLRD